MDEKNMSEEIKAIRIVSDMTQSYDRHLKRMWAAVIALALCVVVMAGCMVYAVSNVQKIANEAMLNALNSVAEIGVTQETTTTTTQTVEGDSATINNVEGEQYTDNATNIGGGE